MLKIDTFDRNLLVMFQKFFSRKCKEDQFWEWFEKHESEYYNQEDYRGELFNELLKQLHLIDPDLTFEFGPVFKNGMREFIVSADGIKKAFSSVIKLVDCVPKIDHWEIVAFRQPHLNHSVIECDGISVSFDDTFFRYAKDNGKIGLELNFRNFDEIGERKILIFLLLDAVIGEYETEMSLSWIDSKQLNEEEVSSLIPIVELPDILRNYKKELSN